ncbi:MAG: DUF433 domain-containing protein, partial [Nitrospiraceae bacterium]
MEGFGRGLTSHRLVTCADLNRYATLPLVAKVTHPHIVIDPAVCGGSPRIVNTRITVRAVAITVLHHGQTPEDLLAHYPHLSLASIYDALSYYYDNRDEIDREIADHEALDPAI